MTTSKKIISDFILSRLEILKSCLQNNTFEAIESAFLELKSISSTAGEWKSLYETICSFLNTDGGYIILGIHEDEKNKKYILGGFNRNEEEKLRTINDFKTIDGLDFNVDDYLFIDYEWIEKKTIAIVCVQPLSNDLKYVSYKSNYYKRVVTGDKKISAEDIKKQKEFIEEYKTAIELEIIEKATIKDFNLDKINNYIRTINLEIKKETLKSSLTKSKEFLIKQFFIIEEQVSTLGMLVCGDDPFHFLSTRVEVDCYYDTRLDIGKDRKILRNDVLSLMEDSFTYIWGHIRKARTITNGGSQVPQYPEVVIREVINNALAHRDYKIEDFVSITIEPDQHIQIMNPGSFKKKMLIESSSEKVYRIVPGITANNNPKLASVLKTFDKLENRGRGMASLVNNTLENLIDVPYYDLKIPDRITLYIPCGRLLDEAITSWLDGFMQYILDKLNQKILSEGHRSVLAYFYKSERLNKRGLHTILVTESNNHFNAIEDLEKAQLIYKHSSSTPAHPIFILDRVLLQEQFMEEISCLFHKQTANLFQWSQYSEVEQSILNILYRDTVYNKKGLKPSKITAQIYERIYGAIIDAKKYETLARSVRAKCSSFYKDDLLDKAKDGSYSIKINFVLE